MSDPPKQILTAAARAAIPEVKFSHPLEPRSEIRGHSLSDAVGLRRLGAFLVRIAPGKTSFPYHRHHGEEELVYVLSGHGVVEIDGVDHPIGAGDFLGFATEPAIAHQIRNDGDEDLVYFTAGERHTLEVAEFPRAGKYIVRVGAKASLFDAEAGVGLAFFKRLHEE